MNFLESNKPHKRRLALVSLLNTSYTSNSLLFVCMCVWERERERERKKETGNTQ